MIVLKRNVRTALRILTGIALVIFSGIAYYLGTRTLADLWIPWSVSLGIALISGVFAWKIWIPLTSSMRFIINFPIHLMAVTAICGFLIFTTNYVWADAQSRKIVNAEVCNRYSKTRYHTKRVGRHYTAKGNPYKGYYIEIEFPDGRKKEAGVSLSQYSRIKKGSKLMVAVEKGFLSMPVMKEMNSQRKLEIPCKGR